MTDAFYVHEAGPRGAPTIVFLHGGGLSGRMWQPQLERLPEFHRLVPDLPEQGRSAGIAPFALADTVARVATLIRTRATDGRAHVVGLSVGGAVGLTLLHRVPELVDHAVVSGTAARVGWVLGAVSKASGQIYRVVPTATLVNAALKQFRIPSEYIAAMRDDLQTSTSRVFVRHVTDALIALELPHSSRSPLLAAVGERETGVAKRAARTLVTHVPGARGVVAPQVGHVWNLEAPELFSAMVRAWCTDSALPAQLRPL